MSQAEERSTEPFLVDVINFLRPKIQEDRRNDMLKLAVSWLTGELRTYGRTYETDDISCTVELHKCHINLPLEPGKGVHVYGYQLLVTLQGDAPHHPAKQCDCIFAVENEHSDVVVNLYLPGERPDGTSGTAVQ
jgi:hypothetical protein